MTIDIENSPLAKETKELILRGTWTIEETDTGYVIKTEPYSWCCNKEGQTKFYLDSNFLVVSVEGPKHNHGS